MIKLGELLSIINNIDRVVIYDKNTNETKYIHVDDDNYFRLFSSHMLVDTIDFTSDYGDKCLYIELSDIG